MAEKRTWETPVLTWRKRDPDWDTQKYYVSDDGIFLCDEIKELFEIQGNPPIQIHISTEDHPESILFAICDGERIILDLGSRARLVYNFGLIDWARRKGIKDIHWYYASVWIIDG